MLQFPCYPEQHIGIATATKMLNGAGDNMQPCITPIINSRKSLRESIHCHFVFISKKSHDNRAIHKLYDRYKDVCWIQNMQTTAYSTCSRNLLFSDFYLEIRWQVFCGAVTLCFREFFQQNFVCTVDTVKNAFQYRCKFLVYRINVNAMK